MKIVLIRHGEPSPIDHKLTEKGVLDVKALKEFYKNEHIDKVFSSPLDRALDTCKIFLEERDEKYVICPWLEEFVHPVYLKNNEEPVLNWDFLPSFYTKNDDLYDPKTYLETEVMKSGNIKHYYDYVTSNFDKILEENGYKRSGKYYEVIDSNRDVLVFFCHLGIISVILSHLTGIPYSVLAQGFACPTTGVTTIYSEEREKGIAQFRCVSYGDISHLKANNIKPSFHARFCETFDSDERH